MCISAKSVTCVPITYDYIIISGTGRTKVEPVDDCPTSLRKKPKKESLTMDDTHLLT
jgi:hypothetical protein